MAKDRSDDMDVQNDQANPKLADTLPEEKEKLHVSSLKNWTMRTCKALFCLVRRRKRIFWNFPTR